MKTVEYSCKCGYSDMFRQSGAPLPVLVFCPECDKHLVGHKPGESAPEMRIMAFDGAASEKVPRETSLTGGDDV